MTYRIVFFERAKGDIAWIREWLAKRSELGASRWYNAMIEAVNDLAKSAGRWSRAPEARRLKQPIRQRLFKTRHGNFYRLLDEIVDDEVRILRVRAKGLPLLKRGDL